MATGPVAALVWATYKDELKSYCQVDGTTYDAVLERLFNAAKAKADTFLNNPFEVYNPTIKLTGVAADDWVTINGQTYTAATVGDEEDLEFAVGATDLLTADNLCLLINSTTLGGSYGSIGVPGVTATNSAGTIALTRRYPYPDTRAINVESADDDTMMVRQVRTAGSVPQEVVQWIYEYTFRHFRNPAAMAQENDVGMYAMGGAMTDTFDLISKYRIPVGF
jgi:hypothetical protein